MTVYGAPWCPHCKRVKKFLAAHRVRYAFVDIDTDPQAIARLKELQDGGQIIPTVVYPDGTHEVNPGNEALARRIGLTLKAERSAYDLVIVGGGPAGLAAAIYAAREGIDAVVVDASALGGQAGTSDRIDNYPGFPDGISGGELADRFVAQARRYGVELVSAVSVTGLQRDHEDLVTSLSSGQQLTSHAVIVATGSTYRMLDVPGEDDLIGAGVHFCATCDAPFYKGAEEVRSNVVCDALLLDETSKTDTYPYIEVEEERASIGHEATVSKVAEEQIFYLMSRGLSEDEAMSMIVNGFIEPIAKELPLEYAVELNRLIQLEMEGSVG